MQLDYAILTDVVSHRPDGKIDIIGAGFDTIFAAGVPATHPRMDLAIRILVSAHEVANPHKLDVIILGSDGAEAAKLVAEFPPMPDEQRAQLPAGRQLGIGAVLTFANLVFAEYGTYNVVVHWDGNEARDPIRLYVEPLPAAPAQ